MKLAAHIPFYLVAERLPYLHRVLEGLSGMPHDVTAFIYSNEVFDPGGPYGGLDVRVVHVRFRRLPILHDTIVRRLPRAMRRRFDPHFLTWACRECAEGVRDAYDAQMYLEDDIGFTREAFDYWLEHKDRCLAHGYNPGFLRYETDGGRTFCTDLTRMPRRLVRIDEELCLLNDRHPYCGMWIYDRDELANFMRSPEWTFKSAGYDIREQSAMGWHGEKMGRYQGSVIPLRRVDAETFTIDRRCGLHHLPDNYIGHRAFCTIEFPLRFRSFR